MRTERQRDFLEAAIEIVAAEGFSRLTIRNVAASVGVTEPAVYRHFPSKLALVTAMLEELQASVLPLLRRLGEQAGSLDDALGRFIHGIFDELKRQPSFAPFIFSEEVFHSEPQLKPMLFRVMKENLTVLGDSIALLQDGRLCRNDASPQSLALVMMGSIRLAISAWHLGEGSFRLADQADQLIRTLAALLRIPETPV